MVEFALGEVYGPRDTHASDWCEGDPWNSRREALQTGTMPLVLHFISCEFPLGSPYALGECELVGVLRHAPPSRVGCPTLGLWDSRFYKFCLTHQQKKSVKIHSLLLKKVYGETDTNASGWWCDPWDSTKESLQMAPCHWFSIFISCEFPLVFLYDLVACEIVEVLMHAPLVGLGAPPWVCEIAGSTNFV